MIHLLIAYYFEDYSRLVDSTVILGEVFYFFDVFLHLLHMFWPIVRLHMRVYRRNYILLLYDVISLLPLGFICEYYTRV